MKTLLIFFAALSLTALSAFAADVTGKWTASFDTQVGQQNYTYQLKVDGAKVTGTASSQNGETELLEGKIDGDKITFVENLVYQGMTIRIEYTGTISGDEIKFSRKVADFATEELIATRSK